jgi:hypothetical protein
MGDSAQMAMAIAIAVDASGPSKSGEWNFLTFKVKQETAR